MPQAFESYEGQELNVSDCELLAFAKIPADVRAQESELYGLKWFDYRALHPVKATYLFAHTYTKIIRQVFAEQRDRDKAAAAAVFFPTDIFKNRELLAAVNARQAFDRLGMRYEFALHFVMRRNLDRGWKVFARPNQLYGEELLLDMADAWKIEAAARLQIPNHPRFRAENYTGHPDQIAWEASAAAQIDAREHKSMALATLLGRGLLRREAAAQRFPASLVREAEQIAKSLAG